MQRPAPSIDARQHCPRAAEEGDLTDGERREVIVQHEALPRFAFEALDLLSVLGGAQRARDERLGFAAGEHRGAVGARQHAGLDPNRSHLVELAAIEPDTPLEHLVAEHLLLQILEDRFRFQLPLDFALRDVGEQVVDRLDPDRSEHLLPVGVCGRRVAAH